MNKIVKINKNHNRQRRMKMKRRKLKNWVKVTLYSITTAIVIICLLNTLSSLDKDFMKNCTNSGYSVRYCEAHK